MILMFRSQSKFGSIIFSIGIVVLIYLIVDDFTWLLAPDRLSPKLLPALEGLPMFYRMEARSLLSFEITVPGCFLLDDLDLFASLESFYGSGSGSLVFAVETIALL